MHNIPELRLIELAFKKIISDDESISIDVLLKSGTIDWNCLKDLVIYHEMAPFVYLVLRPYRNLVPEDIYQFLDNYYKNSLINNLAKVREYLAIYDIFQQENVDVVPIKGTALIEDLYGEYPVRPMGDVDILIKTEDYVKASEILQRIGYKKNLEGLREDYWLNDQCHVVFIKKQTTSYPIRLELHFRLDFKRKGKEILSSVWGRNREVQIDGRRFKLLSPEDTVFSLALHQRRYGKVFCFKYVLDTALIIQKYKDIFDWGYVQDACRKYKLFSCLYFLLLQVKIFLGEDFSGELEKLSVASIKKTMMRKFISRYIFSFSLSQKVRNNYLKSHFLLYDSFIEPVRYIMDIPLEQFAKYYGLNTYSKKTRFLYKNRFFYMLFKIAKG